MRNYEELLGDAQRHFNRREFEQFINPLLQLQAETFERRLKLQIRERFDKFYYEVMQRVNHSAEDIVGDETRVISIDDLKIILEAVKSTTV